MKLKQQEVRIKENDDDLNKGNLLYEARIEDLIKTRDGLIKASNEDKENFEVLKNDKDKVISNLNGQVKLKELELDEKSRAIETLKAPNLTGPFR